MSQNSQSWADRNIGKSKGAKIGAVIATALLILSVGIFLSGVHVPASKPVQEPKSEIMTVYLGQIICETTNYQYLFAGISDSNSTSFGLHTLNILIRSNAYGTFGSIQLTFDALHLQPFHIEDKVLSISAWSNDLIELKEIV